MDHPETVKPCDTGRLRDFLQFNWFNEQISITKMLSLVLQRLNNESHLKERQIALLLEQVERIKLPKAPRGDPKSQVHLPDQPPAPFQLNLELCGSSKKNGGHCTHFLAQQELDSTLSHHLFL